MHTQIVPILSPWNLDALLKGEEQRRFSCDTGLWLFRDIFTWLGSVGCTLQSASSLSPAIGTYCCFALPAVKFTPVDPPSVPPPRPHLPWCCSGKADRTERSLGKCSSLIPGSHSYMPLETLFLNKAHSCSWQSVRGAQTGGDFRTSVTAS